MNGWYRANQRPICIGLVVVTPGTELTRLREWQYELMGFQQ